MRVLGDSWCFCNGGGKSERTKAAIFSGKSPAMARVNGGSTGFLIHRNLLLTTHASLPSAAAAESAEIQLVNGVLAFLFPHRFFITSSVLDLTIVGLDVMDGESNASAAHHVYYLKSSCSKANLELGTLVYLLGFCEKQELAVGEGKVVIATDNLIKLSTEEGVLWSPGCAGFDDRGNLAFMVCDPMKLATSPNTKSCSTSSSSSPDFPMQFAIPIPIILDWLNQHWEGNLDELSKPKLPLKRLISSGQKSEFSCPSFTMRRVFKSVEGENEQGVMPASSNTICPTTAHPGPFLNTLEEEALDGGDRRNIDTHVSSIPTPEIYESPVPVGKKIQLLDINFPPRVVPKPPAQVPVAGKAKSCSCEEEEASVHAESAGSVNGALQSNSSPDGDDIPEHPHEYSSEGETTMYSAETAESRNFPCRPSPGKQQQLHKVGRSQSCVNSTRWGGPLQKCSVARGAMLENHRPGRKVHSQGTPATHSSRGNDYFSPTVSSIMKKRNNMELQRRPRESVVPTSPRWMF